MENKPVFFFPLLQRVGEGDQETGRDGRQEQTQSAESFAQTVWLEVPPAGHGCLRRGKTDDSSSLHLLNSVQRFLITFWKKFFCGIRTDY